MAKVDAEYVKSIRDKVQVAKQGAFKAHRDLEATPEFGIAKRADQELELALDLQASLQTLMNRTVV